MAWRHALRSAAGKAERITINSTSRRAAGGEIVMAERFLARLERYCGVPRGRAFSTAWREAEYQLRLACGITKVK